MKNGIALIPCQSSNYIFISSILENFFNEVKYHPLIENFPEYTSLSRERVPYNRTEKFSFGQTLTSGIRSVSMVISSSIFICCSLWFLSEALHWRDLQYRGGDIHCPHQWGDKTNLQMSLDGQTKYPRSSVQPQDYYGICEFRCGAVVADTLGPLTNRLSGYFIIFKEDYVVKPVDLISGIGGTLGLWLGLSLFSIGTFIIQRIESIPLKRFGILK